MSSMDESARWQLPLLAVNQMQKEVTHNEALTLIDMLLAVRVMGTPQNDPPSAPLLGQCWLVGSAPTGDWAGRAGQLAGWTAGGWRWAIPFAGMAVRAADGRRFRYDGTVWTAPTALTPPTGGTTIDSQARDALTAVIQALKDHGLLA
jgi:hypothetical protein